MIRKPPLEGTMLLPDAPAPEGDNVVARPDFDGCLDLGVIGRGGMAEVHRLLDFDMEREIAAKVVHPKLSAPALGEALTREARIMGRLEHPYVVPVHARGVSTSGRPYFTMRLVEGRTLTQWLSKAGDDERADALEILLKVCDAVRFAHERGYVHRDIKPDNIMVGDFGEVFLMDWGLALKHDEAALGQNLTGTLAFMAPEQATGAPIDVRTDVFLLGGVLYYILAKCPPYEAEARALLVVNVTMGATVDLLDRGLEPAPPAELVAIVRRALAPRPEDRYPNVLAFMREVRAVLRSGRLLPERRFHAGEMLIRQGDHSTEAYVIREGSVRVLQGASGEQRVLRTLGPGDVFGELGVISDAPRTASIEAITDGVVQVVTKELLDKGLGTAWMGLFVRALAERYRELEAKNG